MLRLPSEGLFFTKSLQAWLIQRAAGRSRAGAADALYNVTTLPASFSAESPSSTMRMLPTGALAPLPQPLWLDRSRQDQSPRTEYCLQCIRYSSHSGYDLAKCYFGLAVCCLDCSSKLQHCLLLILLLHIYFRQPNPEHIYGMVSVWQKSDTEHLHMTHYIT